MKNYLVLIATVLITTIANAQTDFSGAWAEPRLEMMDGIQYSNAVPKLLTVIQTTDSIKIIRVEVGAETGFTQVLALDGKTVSGVGKSSKRTVQYTATWGPGKKILTIKTVYSYAGKPAEPEYSNTELWEMVAGDLVITKISDAAVTDDWTIKAIYKRQ
jgi:hypothetical protein